jgi:hypothetical protein
MMKARYSDDVMSEIGLRGQLQLLLHGVGEQTCTGAHLWHRLCDGRDNDTVTLI